MCSSEDELETHWIMFTIRYSVLSDGTFFRLRSLLYKYTFGSEESGLVIQAFLFFSPLSHKTHKQLKYLKAMSSHDVKIDSSRSFC